jgi:hypothetical protein
VDRLGSDEFQPARGGIKRGGRGSADLVAALPGAFFTWRQPRRTTGNVAAPPADAALVTHRDDNRRPHLEHSSGDQLVARGGIALLEPEQVPIEISAIGGELHSWKEQCASEVVSHDFAGATRRAFRLNAERGKHAIGNALADLMRDSPLHSLGSLCRADNDRSLFLVAARMVGQADEATANGHHFAVGDDKPNPLGDLRGIDRRLGDARFPEGRFQVSNATDLKQYVR